MNFKRIFFFRKVSFKEKTITTKLYIFIYYSGIFFLLMAECRWFQLLKINLGFNLQTKSNLIVRTVLLLMTVSK